MKNILVTLLLLSFSAGTAYANCDIKYIPLGGSAASVVEKYGLDRLGTYAGKRTEIVARGTDICSELPKNSKSRFIFINDKLVQVEIVNSSFSPLLLKIIEDNYGEAENKPNENHPGKNNFNLSWVKKGQHVVSYSSRGAKMNSLNESLVISSLRHRRAFERSYEEEEKNMDR